MRMRSRTDAKLVIITWRVDVLKCMKRSNFALASPLYADLDGLPALRIQVGSSEVLLDDATRLAERASKAGVETTLEVWPEMIHVWHTFAAILPEGREAIARIGEFVRMHLGD